MKTAKAKNPQKSNNDERMIQKDKLVSVGQMALDIVHDMSTPLSAALFYSSLMADQIHNLEASHKAITTKHLKESNKHMMTALNMIYKIVTNLKSYAFNNESGTFHLVSLDKIIQDTLVLCQSRINKFGIKLILPPFIPKEFKLECLPEQIEQVFINLFNNSIDAIKFNTEKWIKLELYDQEHHIEISISDSGHGIPSEIHEKIFEAYFTTKDENQNMGLGLNICQKIIKSHAGHIKIVEECPHTKFLIYLPKSRVKIIKER